MVRKRSGRPVDFRLLVFLLSASGLLVTVSCQKGGKCLSNSGPTISQERPVSPSEKIKTIDLADNVNLYIAQGPTTKVTVEAGSNIISGITTDIHYDTTTYKIKIDSVTIKDSVAIDTILSIRNLNMCNWLRSYDRPLNVYVQSNRLLKVSYDGSGNVASSSPLIGRDFTIDIMGGCGSINLDFQKVTNIYCNMNAGTADVNLTGTCTTANFFLNNTGLCRADGLVDTICYVTHSGTNNCYVNVLRELTVVIKNIGDVYYKTGTDNCFIISTITGSGHLFHE